MNWNDDGWLAWLVGLAGWLAPRFSELIRSVRMQRSVQMKTFCYFSKQCNTSRTHHISTTNMMRVFVICAGLCALCASASLVRTTDKSEISRFSCALPSTFYIIHNTPYRRHSQAMRCWHNPACHTHSGWTQRAIERLANAEKKTHNQIDEKECSKCVWLVCVRTADPRRVPLGRS